MAFSRSLSSRATLIARRYQPSFAYIFHDDDRKNHPSTEPQSTQKPGNFGQQRSFGTGFSNSSSGLCGVLFHDRRCSQLAFLPGTGVSFGRFMSTKVNDGAKEVELMTDVAEAFKDTAIEAVTSQVPAVNEVAVAAADCWLPVATLQYVIDAVHSFTGFNWWASIVVTTLLIRSATVPLLINQLKATTKMTGVAAHETTSTTTKRSRRKKTFAELKEEESLLVKESIYLKKEIASMRATCKEQRARNENLKRIKRDLNLSTAKNEPEEVPSCQPHPRVPSSLDYVMSTSPSHAIDDCKAMLDSCNIGKALLPDLNMMPVEDESGAETLHGSS